MATDTYFYCLISQHIERVKIYYKFEVFIIIKLSPSHKHKLSQYPLSTQGVYHIQYPAVFDV